MDGWMDRSTGDQSNQSIIGLLNRYFHMLRTEPSRHLNFVKIQCKDLIINLKKAYHNITLCPGKLCRANYLHWQGEWERCCWTPLLPIINRVGFPATGNIENWINKPTVSFKSLAKRVSLKTSSSRKSYRLSVWWLCPVFVVASTQVCRARHTWLHHERLYAA